VAHVLESLPSNHEAPSSTSNLQYHQNKNNKKEVGLRQTEKLMHDKGNKKAIDGMGENIFKPYLFKWII
jgi:hypothetical protein